ncbi:hypothetical protein QBC40DRAFT_249928 [Triangularia verruculosa]|uniref:Uncharacterized protein n=1 Tax=Triangularia verruculosa TaxID=2587418 RepID=A0AAN6XU00_9PEZI|nr:hypothetical protein QBC40DRAFT_249928 [Triangularia verruculosa]
MSSTSNPCEGSNFTLIIITIALAAVALPVSLLLSTKIVMRFRRQEKLTKACPNCHSAYIDLEVARAIATERIRREGEERFPEHVQLAELVERVEESAVVEHIELGQTARTGRSAQRG